MPPDLKAHLYPILMVLLFAVIFYRRVRANIGPQKLRRIGLVLRTTIFTLAGGTFLVGLWTMHIGMIYAAGGIAIGAGLAAYALRHTKYDFSDRGIFYTGHPVIGIGVTMLFLGRVLYRMTQISAAVGPTDAKSSMAMTLNNPITTALFFLAAAYHIGFSLGILLKTRRPTVTSVIAGDPQG
jgi:hypothetical protein